MEKERSTETQGSEEAGVGEAKINLKIQRYWLQLKESIASICPKFIQIHLLIVHSCMPNTGQDWTVTEHSFVKVDLLDLLEQLCFIEERE